MLVRWYHNFFCSIFTYYSHSWAYGGGAPQLWAIVILSAIPTVGLWSIEIMLYPPGSVTPEFFKMFADLPGFVKQGWIFLVLLVANGYYFLSGRAWIGIVDNFKTLSGEGRKYRHIVCAFFVGADVLILFFVLLNTD